MKRSQCLAIYYATRDRRIERIKKAGLYESFLNYNKGKKYLVIAPFLRKCGRLDLW